MKKIYSLINPKVLLVELFNIENLNDKTYHSGTEKEILQVSAFKFNMGDNILPHHHLPVCRTLIGTQESIIVWSGAIEAFVYDLNFSLLTQLNLVEGDCITLYRGGHAYIVKENNTKILEFKNGPYYGKEHDSQSIDW